MIPNLQMIFWNVMMVICAMYCRKKIFGNCVNYVTGMISDGDENEINIGLLQKRKKGVVVGEIER